MSNKYTFFWAGVFSQWYKSDFIIDDITFNTAEQWMMYSKAKMFDPDMMPIILQEKNPRKQKDLGRQIKNFNKEEWEASAQEIVYQGNYAKFTQNRELFNALIDTAGTLLVEAAPNDVIWGIGLREEEAIQIEEAYWPGLNWLGLVLTQLREDILTAE